MSCVSDTALRYPALVESLSESMPALATGLCVTRLDDVEALIVTKTTPGFDAPVIAALRDIIRDAAAGRLGLLKFLAFDFAHEGFPFSTAVEGFDELVAELSNLILAAPVVSVASARTGMTGANLEFALACSMTIAEDGAQFSFAGDALMSMNAYGMLSQKLGFVRAERLMEQGDILDAARMQELLLLKTVTEAGSGVAGIGAFLRKAARRHNFSYGMYRAQRIAIRPAGEILRA